MKFKTIAGYLLLVIFMLTGASGAEDDPETLVKAAAEATETATQKRLSPQQRWENFLHERGWNRALSEGGVIIIPDRELILSAASAFTKVRVGQPGWIESKVAAFEQAEMEAKTKIIRYLSETTETQRSLSMLEHAFWEDGEVERVKKLGKVAETLKRIGKKTLDLAEAKLDNLLQELDPDYDPAEYEGKSAEELKIITEDLFNRQIKSVAMKTLIGVTQLYSTEDDSGGGEYEVLVGTIWSPKLNRLAVSLFNDEYNIPKVSPGKHLAEHIPTDQLNLLATVGTRIVIDENGQYAVLSFGQAQPRRASPSRKQAALQRAKQIAANRGRSHMVNFIREGMTMREEEISRELSREFSDMPVGTETLREYRKLIDSKNVQVKLRGVRVLKEWSLEHPATGQDVAGAVIAWSPASADLSGKAEEMMKSRPKAEGAGKQEEKASDSGPSLESMPVDTSAY